MTEQEKNEGMLLRKSGILGLRGISGRQMNNGLRKGFWVRKATDVELFAEIDREFANLQDHLKAEIVYIPDIQNYYMSSSTALCIIALIRLAREVRKRYPEGEPEEIRTFACLKAEVA